MGFSRTGSTVKSAPLQQHPDKRSKCVLNKLQFDNNVKNDLIHVGTKSETFMRPVGLPPRPSTRRHPYETPKIVQKTRSHSLGSVDRNCLIQKEIRPVKRRKQTKKKSPIKSKANEVFQANCESKQLGSRDKNRKGSLSDRSDVIKSAKCKTDEHEYLQFILRITEDIITNDYAENDDLLKLFNSHFEANKHRLDETKMELHLMLLARELQMPYKNSLELPLEETPTVTDINHKAATAAVVDGDCECTSKRSLDIKKILPYDNIFDDAKDTADTGVVLLNTHSLSRVTECTEPTNSVDTIFNASSKFPSVTTVSSFGNIDVLPGFENLDIQRKFTEMRLADRLRLPQRTSNPIDIFGGVADKQDPLIEQIIDTDCNALNEVMDDHYSIESQKSNSSILKNEKQQISTCTTDTASVTDNSAKTVINNDNIVSVCCEINIENVDNNNCQNDTNITISDDLVESVSSNLIIKPDEHEVKIIAIDRSTQISLEHFEQQNSATNNSSSSSSAKIKETVTEEEENEYVLISKPIYVLKKILDSDEKLILVKDAMSITTKDLRVQLQEPELLQPANYCDNIVENNYSTDNINSDNRINFQEKKTDAQPLLLSSSGTVAIQTQVDVANSDTVKTIQSTRYSDISEDKSQSLHQPFICPEPNIVNNNNNNPLLCDLTYVESSGGKHFEDLNRASASDNTLNLSDYSMKSMSSEIDAYYKMNYAKLLTSDYDMTPQRDHPSTDKYHHLLVDAATSISNVNIANSNQNLLLTDDYVIMPNIGDHWMCRNCSKSNRYEKNLDTGYNSITKHVELIDEEDSSVASSKHSVCVCGVRDHGIDNCDTIDRYDVQHEQEMRRSKTFLLPDGGGVPIGRRFMMTKAKAVLSNSVAVDVQSSSADSVYNSSMEQGRIHEEHCQTERSQIDCTTSTSGLA